MNRRLLLAGLLLALALLCVFGLMRPGDEGAPGKLEGATEPASRQAPDPLTSDPLTGGAAARPVRAPALRTRGEASAAPRHDAIITVRGPTAAVRVGAPVRVRDPQAGHEDVLRVTDDEGQVHLAQVPFDGSIEVAVLSSWRPDASVLASVRVSQAEHDILCTAGLVLETTFLDGVTGLEMPGPAWMPEPNAPAASASVEGRATVAALPGDTLRVGFSLPTTVLPAHVAWDPSVWQVAIARRARRLVARYPLRRQARVWVRAENADGTPSTRARVAGYALAGRRMSRGFTTRVEEAGIRLLGAPYFGRRPIEVLVVPPRAASTEALSVDRMLDLVIEMLAHRREFVLEDIWDMNEGTIHPGAAVGRAVLPARWADACFVRARFPADAKAPITWGDASLETFFLDHRRPALHLAFPTPRIERGRVEVRVLDRAGRPIAGAQVSCHTEEGRSDAQGIVRFPSILAGGHEALLTEPGFVRTAAPVVVRPGRLMRVTLREAEGGSLRVRVVDDRDRPLPFALIALDRGAGWVDIEDGVQRIDPFTDLAGRRTLSRVPAGKRTVRAHWGGLDGKASVDVVSGGTAEVLITLKE